MYGIKNQPPIKSLLFNLAQQGQISPQALGMVLQFMQARAQHRQMRGGGQPGQQFGAAPRMSPQQRQAVQQLRQLMGNNFNPFVRNLMRGGPGGINKLMKQIPGCGCGPKKAAPAMPKACAPRPKVCAPRPKICGPKAQPQQPVAQQPKVCAPRPKVCGPTAQPQQPVELKGKEKGGWLAAHKHKKKDGDGWKITGGEYKGCTVKATKTKGVFDVFDANGAKKGIYKAPKGKNKIASPLTFDLNGDGKVSTTDAKNGKKFDIDGDGKADQTSWAGKGDGVLAFGKGNSGKELLGNNTDLGDGKKYKNGFDALKGLAEKHLGADATKDGVLDKWELSQLEKAANLHMKVDGQNKSLADAGIAGINLGYTENGANADENGNEHRQVGAGFIRDNGDVGKVNDVWFQYL
ncbi:MAG: hypothetical protein RMA76_12170 [Deltaproteobacteria bacterium]